MFKFEKGFLVFGERTTVHINYKNEILNENSLVFASIDSFTIDNTNIKTNTNRVQLSKSLRRMRSVESLHSTNSLNSINSELTVHSPLNLLDINNNEKKSLIYGTNNTEDGTWDLPLSISLGKKLANKSIGTSEMTSEGIATIKVSIYQKIFKKPEIERNGTSASKYLINMLTKELSLITEVIKLGTLISLKR